MLDFQVEISNTNCIEKGQQIVFGLNIAVVYSTVHLWLHLYLRSMIDFLPHLYIKYTLFHNISKPFVFDFFVRMLASIHVLAW